jgi:hypothetical protein
MNLALEDADIVGVVLVIAYGTAFVVIAVWLLLGRMKRRWGALPRGTRWIAPLWQRVKEGSSGTLLRVFYPEVWAERRTKQIIAGRKEVRPETVKSNVAYDADKGRFVSKTTGEDVI